MLSIVRYISTFLLVRLYPKPTKLGLQRGDALFIGHHRLSRTRVVVMTGHPLQVFGAVIEFVPVLVVNHPVLRERLALHLLPDDDVLTPIPPFAANPEHDIAILFDAASTP